MLGQKELVPTWNHLLVGEESGLVSFLIISDILEDNYYVSPQYFLLLTEKTLPKCSGHSLSATLTVLTHRGTTRTAG